MHLGTGLGTARGVVLSDLHLFAQRSRGVDCVNRLRAELASATILVLNGDIFDSCDHV
jgi:UDP-2,3-diacylglucosamine pyrophosphatase LpxH